MTVSFSYDLIPNIHEMRDMRERTGMGLVECRKQILRERIEVALECAEPTTPTEKLLVAVLQAGMGHGVF